MSHKTTSIPKLDLARIEELASAQTEPDAARLTDVLAKARERAGLSLEETAELLRARDPEARERILASAREVKEGIYGRRMVLFAPLYASNECSNNCLYCAFRKDNTALVRRTLTMAEIAQEVRAIEAMGHKRILLVVGESPKSGLDYATRAVQTIYKTKEGQGEIRRVNVNMAPLSVEDFRELKAVGIGTYQSFQETYHPEQYAHLHPSGRKADYAWRLGVFDRAFAAGIDDVGLGVLYGLYDYRFDTLALLAHAEYLDERYGVGPHTLSFPRIEPAQNAPAAERVPYPVSDDEILQVVAVLRLSCPYTGIIMSTREVPELRRQLLGLGVSQLSAASRTYPGAYSDGRSHVEEREQFSLGDTRPADVVIRELAGEGYLPSFCTACYRLGRTGHDFMDKAKPGDIQSFCTPNAVLTFQEYLLDYASAETRAVGEKTIAQALGEVTPRLRKTVMERLERIRAGERDLYF
ncbi:MAG: [FeFe] hydrogenase H-cluster radical SAM maturase HydG [Armatimonadetes bacterium]|nr:[FeFe] hydrogenase H-cluster radical SAM maturase HydG [Armatimonadota bacterium]